VVEFVNREETKPKGQSEATIRRRTDSTNSKALLHALEHRISDKGKM
jgi:retron-type reverse transcriptase